MSGKKEKAARRAAGVDLKAERAAAIERKRLAEEQEAAERKALNESLQVRRGRGLPMAALLASALSVPPPPRLR